MAFECPMGMNVIECPLEINVNEGPTGLNLCPRGINETYEPPPSLVSTSSWYVGFVVGVILRTQYPLLPVRARPCIFVILGNHAMRGHKL